ncbi:hypothetical protein NM688_g4814 [Phlebia brevispora]|uniref:Uncharacterized protein n=1 Tax=Phlebia brevispora TaxID=194682 RepID=A0ACC1T1Z3_9APHY|nr:hypothetical protein NM688_g4814 [Phlebia brevispora]
MSQIAANVVVGRLQSSHYPSSRLRFVKRGRLLVFFASVLYSTLLLRCNATALNITTPPNSTSCTPIPLQWSGESPPYTVRVFGMSLLAGCKPSSSSSCEASNMIYELGVEGTLMKLVVGSNQVNMSTWYYMVFVEHGSDVTDSAISDNFNISPGSGTCDGELADAVPADFSTTSSSKPTQSSGIGSSTSNPSPTSSGGGTSSTSNSASPTQTDGANSDKNKPFDDTGSSKHHSNDDTIIGAVVGSVGGTLFAAIVFLFWRRWSNRRSRKGQWDVEIDDDGPPAHLLFLHAIFVCR